MRASLTTGVDESGEGWGISLLFWVCLLVAAGLFAAVALAPRLLTYLELRAEYESNQQQLVSLEQQVDSLRRVVAAFENEPEFTAELARIDFDASRPGDERIAVDRRLSLDAGPRPARPVKSSASFDWPRRPLSVIAHETIVRRTALVFAALLTIVAFTFFQEPAESTAGEKKATRRPGLFRAIAQRYSGR